MGRLAGLSVLATLLMCACGERAPLPQACVEAHSGDVLRALRTAPRDVALHDGTRLSTCVERALGDAELQALGATLTEAAARLAQRLAVSDDAAIQLGFLIGATERGAARTTGVQSELSDRIARAAGLDGGPAERRGALERARAAGRRHG